MKTLLALVSTFVLSASVQALEVMPEYYAANFEVEKVSPMCPNTVPTNAVCMGIGSIVTLKATIGCGDELLFTDTDFHAPELLPVVSLYVVSVVKRHPDSARLRCVKANVVRMTLTVPVHAINYNVANLGVETPNE